MIRRFWIILILIVFCVPEFFGQDSLTVYYKRDFKGKRPKIGLVLSGGGAKGMAHVGVLKVMERAGIKPDYITGTSMGSIVGGLYSIGFSADSLEKLVGTQDWSALLSNKMEFRHVNIEEKRDYGEYIAEFPIYGWKPQLPQGAIKGQELELLFNKLTVSVAGDTNFASYHIPFRAVSVDMITGEPYIFKSGNLATAMRASMSIPSIMDPVKYKGMLLVDGGLITNFPVQECIDMGANIVIGVYTGGELLPEEKLNSLYALLKQSSFLWGIKNAEKERKYVDIYIEPYLSDQSAADFMAGEVIMDRGFQAASQRYADFKKLADFMNNYPDPITKEVRLMDSVHIAANGITVISDTNKYVNIFDNEFKSSGDR